MDLRDPGRSGLPACPSHAYPTYKQWRNDLPYYRSIEDGLRTRYGIDIGIYQPGGQLFVGTQTDRGRSSKRPRGMR